MFIVFQTRLLIICLIVVACIATALFVARKSAFYQDMLMNTSGRELSLDGLRGLLATGVFAHHCDFMLHWLNTGSWSSDSRLIIFLGQGAVMMFFMITAYLFWAKAIVGKGKISPLGLMRGRLRRLAPLYLLSAALALIYLLPALSQLSWVNCVRYLVCLFSLGLLKWPAVPDLTLFNCGVQWTLWFEWRFYLLLPFLAWFAVGRRVFVLCCLIYASIMFNKYAFGTLGSGYWTAFIPGLLAAQFLRNNHYRSLMQKSFIAGAAVVWLIILLGWTQCSDVRWIPLALTPLFFTISAGNTFGGILTHPSTRILGTISFSLYLIHGIILTTTLKLLASIMGEQLTQPIYYAISVTGLSVMVILICSLTYRFIEHPFIKSMSMRPVLLNQSQANCI